MSNLPIIGVKVICERCNKQHSVVPTRARIVCESFVWQCQCGSPVVYVTKIIKEARTKLGLSQTAFADWLGVSQSRVSKMESGQLELSLNVYLKVLSVVSPSVGSTSRLCGVCGQREADGQSERPDCPSLKEGGV